jgi:hypothetical protein
LDGHDVRRGLVRRSGSHLFVALTIFGPDASRWAPEDHLVVLRDGEDNKLRWVDRTGGAEVDGSQFLVWRLEWPGGDVVRIRYFEGDELAHEEVITLGPADPRAAFAVLQGHEHALIADDWLDGATHLDASCRPPDRS